MTTKGLFHKAILIRTLPESSGYFMHFIDFLTTWDRNPPKKLGKMLDTFVKRHHGKCQYHPKVAYLLIFHVNTFFPVPKISCLDWYKTLV